MSILITSGFEKKWCEFAQSRLVNMGVATSEKSRRNELDAFGFLDKMCGTYKLSVERSRSFRQIDPGKAWQLAAADLVIENSDIDDWGWADPRNLFFLEFWREFDSACKFLLVYGSLQQSIANHIEAKGSFPKSPDAWISRWNGYHSELLSFYHDNPDRCLLVHVSELSGNANELARKLHSTLAVPARLLNSEDFLPEDSISTLASSQILQDGAFKDSSHERLYKELENAANLPDGKSADTSQIAENALKDYRESQENNERLSQKLESQEKVFNDTLRDYHTSEKNNEWLSQKLETQDKITVGLRGDLTSIKQKILIRDADIKGLQESIVQKETLLKELTHEHKQELKKETNSKSKEITRLNSELEKQVTKEQENELLLLQLHQVQEELEYYFSKFQQLKSPENSNNEHEHSDYDGQNTSNPKQVLGQEHVIIDFRSFVDGAGWHSPEDIGRWAGISNESTVNLPSLEPGKYLLNVKIIDGMDTQIFKGLKLFLDGEMVNISKKLMANLTGPLAPIRRIKAELGRIEKPYPVEVSGVFTIPEKTTQEKTHILSFNVTNTVSPADLGEQDTRHLSLCYQLLEIVKI
jgi:hypothetical protein